LEKKKKKKNQIGCHIYCWSRIDCYQSMRKEVFMDQKYFHGTIKYNKTI